MPKQEKAREAAEAIAVQALAFLAGEPARVERFLKETGVDPAQVRRLAGQRAFLAAVLDYLCADERLLLAFADESQHPVRTITAAQARLSGPAWERDTA